jgi:hypothetical protein
VYYWYLFVTKISSQIPVFNTGYQSEGQSVSPRARIWGSVVIFRSLTGSARNQVWETVAWPINKYYSEIITKRKFFLMSNWVSADVLQKSLWETLSQYLSALIPNVPLRQYKACTITTKYEIINNNAFFEDIDTPKRSAEWKYSNFATATFVVCLVQLTLLARIAIGTTGRYGLDGSGDANSVEVRFPHPTTPTLGTTHPTVRWVLGPSGGKPAGACADHPLLSSAEDRTLLYSTSGPS